MNEQKLSKEQLLDYFSTNHKYFMELASYYWKNEPTYYKETILPIIEQNKNPNANNIKTLFESNNKPTTEQLNEFYKNDNKYFMSIANYAYTYDMDYYSDFVYPIILRNKKGAISITCPFCHNNVSPAKISKISTGGIIMIIAGILLAPVIVGLIFIFIGVSMKDYYSVCPICKMKIG
jgi:hypothetical protein